jgi:hypothetical protein
MGHSGNDQDREQKFKINKTIQTALSLPASQISGDVDKILISHVFSISWVRVCMSIHATKKGPPNIPYLHEVFSTVRSQVKIKAFHRTTTFPYILHKEHSLHCGVLHI